MFPSIGRTFGKIDTKGKNCQPQDAITSSDAEFLHAFVAFYFRFFSDLFLFFSFPLRYSVYYSPIVGVIIPDFPALQTWGALYVHRHQPIGKLAGVRNFSIAALFVLSC